MNCSTSYPLKILLLGTGLPLADLRQWQLVTGESDISAQLRRERPDLLLIDAAEVEPDLAATLQSPEFAHIPLILLAGDADAEAVGLLLERPLKIVGQPEHLAAAAAEIAAGLSGGAADARSEYEADERLAALKRDAERVAAALADLAGLRGAEQARAVTAARIRAHIKARRNRERFFAADLLSDPVWDILLDLAAARMEERPVSVSSLCIAAAVPTTTALRTIKMMVDRGMLTRRSDPADARRSFIALTTHSAKAMEGCLEAVLNQPGQ
ncbi:winged helix DNA-binding protein [Sandaracinobacter neustonicus]|uniref:Winged helix DNA-binding protein n=2 Tax=Sandaracinobacter neustonicus TaxID=1715348 RepID=A0A501XKN0_9SPHN|nr:winged helix DNA-binding protein [Sandaracinobacter neustonicus]